MTNESQPSERGDRHFDLCVVGSGPAGQKAAIQAAKLDKRVCIVERKKNLGGVAINTGTIPSKALREAILRLGDAARQKRKSADFLVARSETFTGLLHSCQQLIAEEIDLAEHHLSSNGVEIIRGEATFDDASSLTVREGNSEQGISADYFLIATGTKPSRPEHLEFDGLNLITSDELLELPYLPHSMIVIGGGVIGTEYASMLQALGMRVTLVEARPRLLEFVDSELTEALQYHLRAAEMALRLGERVETFEVIDPPSGARSANDKMGQVTLASGKTLRADCILYCIGRQGATDHLGLDRAGLKPDERGRISVDDDYKTEVPHIYAAGDVIGFPALASTSMEQGRLAVCHMFGQPCEHVPELLPYGIYSIPEISMVGWTEERLTDEGIPYEAGYARYDETARGKMIGDEIGMLKLLFHQETRAMLGVHAIGTGATELIHIGQAAIAFEAPVDYFVKTVFNYPTLAECYKVAALNGLNRLHNV